MNEKNLSIENLSDDVKIILNYLIYFAWTYWIRFGVYHLSFFASKFKTQRRHKSNRSVIPYDSIVRYQSHYIDQSTKFLPPSAYYCNDGVEGGGGSAGVSFDVDPSSSTHGSLPECRTPLSVLCVSTNDMEHRLYLHGRYPLLTLPKCNNGIINTTSSACSMKSPLVVTSNDLVRNPPPHRTAPFCREINSLSSEKAKLILSQSSHSISLLLFTL